MWLIGELGLTARAHRRRRQVRYLLEDALTLDDIATGTSLYRYFEFEIERPKLAQVERWYHRLRERPAFCERVMIPFPESRGRLDY